MDWIIVLLFVLVVPLGYIVQGVSGFGSALVIVPLLSLFVPVRVVAPVLMALGAIVNIQLVWNNRQYLRLRLVLLILAGMFIGAWVGTNLLMVVEDKWLMRTLSVALLVALYLLLRRSPRATNTRSESKVGSIIAGIVGGVGGALFSMNGPPVVLYLNYTNSNPREVRAALYFLFLFSAIWQTVLFVGNGVLNWQIGWLVPLVVPTALLGAYWGNRLAHKIDAARFRQIVAILIVTTALMLWLR